MKPFPAGETTVSEHMPNANHTEEQLGDRGMTTFLTHHTTTNTTFSPSLAHSHHSFTGEFSAPGGYREEDFSRRDGDITPRKTVSLNPEPASI